jgi:hypothetical protein
MVFSILSKQKKVATSSTSDPYHFLDRIGAYCMCVPQKLDVHQLTGLAQKDQRESGRPGRCRATGLCERGQVNLSILILM